MEKQPESRCRVKSVKKCRLDLSAELAIRCYTPSVSVLYHWCYRSHFDITWKGGRKLRTKKLCRHLYFILAILSNQPFKALDKIANMTVMHVENYSINLHFLSRTRCTELEDGGWVVVVLVVVVVVVVVVVMVVVVVVVVVVVTVVDFRAQTCEMHPLSNSVPSVQREEIT